jgi:acyl carrier protein
VASLLERELRRFLAENFPLAHDAAAISPTVSLLGTGILDSTGVLELLGFLEERYSIQVPDEDLLPENFDSIENIVGYLTRKGVEAS